MGTVSRDPGRGFVMSPGSRAAGLPSQTREAGMGRSRSSGLMQYHSEPRPRRMLALHSKNGSSATLALWAAFGGSGGRGARG